MTKTTENVALKGWKLVPVEPTASMREAAASCVTWPESLPETVEGWTMNDLAFRSRYQAAIAAAPAAPVVHDPYAGCERECGGVGAICRCRVDEAAERERLQREVAAPELWAVHAQGPDDLYPAFSREDAEQHAAALNSLSIPGIQVAAVVVPSPWAEAEHWRYLAEQEREHKQELSAAVKHALAEYRAALAGKGCEQ